VCPEQLSALADCSRFPVARKMEVTGWWASGTTYITFEDVKVPVEYVVGKPGNGFRQMMINLNHERWWVAVMANRHARTGAHSL
jgi:alkylation response protein AidB-like acyl-CoA dehydrogenase